MFNFEEALKLIPEQTIVCIGDLMLDDFVYGEVSRISPEAPAPILAVTRNDLNVGGAGNVARNIAALGARCIFLGVVGEDDASRTLMRALAAEPLIEPHLVVDPGASDHAQGPLRLRASFDPSAARRLGTGAAAQCPDRENPDRSCIGRIAACGKRRLVRLCQGGTHPARHPRSHRGGEKGRNTDHRRPQGDRLFHLSGRNGDQAEPQGTFGGDAPPHGDRRRSDRGRAWN